MLRRFVAVAIPLAVVFVVLFVHGVLRAFGKDRDEALGPRARR